MLAAGRHSLCWESWSVLSTNFKFEPPPLYCLRQSPDVGPTLICACVRYFCTVFSASKVCHDKPIYHSREISTLRPPLQSTAPLPDAHRTRVAANTFA